jgi:hypothetical protein
LHKSKRNPQSLKSLLNIGLNLLKRRKSVIKRKQLRERNGLGYKQFTFIENIKMTKLKRSKPIQYNRSKPYFNALVGTSSSKRMDVLNSFPLFVLDDLIEILYNIVLGNTEIGPRKRGIKRYQKALIDLTSANSKKMRRNVVLNQNGGFIGALIPLALSFLTPKFTGD